MAKKESTLANMLITLIVITFVAGFLLGYVNQITIGPKAKANEKRKVEALKAVLPAFDNDLVNDVIWVKTNDNKDSLEIFPAYLKGNLQGFALIGISEKGFSGRIKTMIGYNTDETIFNIVVLEQKETPGLGTKIKDIKFIEQFIGKNPEKFNLKVKKDGGQIDALTGATISTRAFNETIESSFKVLKINKEKFQTTAVETKIQ